ncbi:MAG: helix-turn-helix transcriptional regulator [Firmicutes bacterium]|nr:helix-turn-helix transcriptional regulator [Bacillota bacterium]
MASLVEVIFMLGESCKESGSPSTATPSLNQRVMRRFSEVLPAIFKVHIIDLLEVEWQPHCILESHAHDHWQIFYVIDGGTELRFNKDRVFFLRPRDLVLVEPGIYHEFRQGPRLSCHVFDVKFDFSVTADVFPVLKGISGTIHDKQGLSRIVSHVLEEIANARDGWKAEVMLSLLNLVIRVFRILQARPESLMSGNRIQTISFFDPRLQEIASKAKCYIERHYFEDLDRKKIAKEVFVSPSYLSRIFQVCMGYSPIEYLTLIRIEHARHLLREGDLSIGSIATRVGYKSPQYFTRVFKKVEGLSPVEYREGSRRRSIQETLRDSSICLTQ